MIVFRPTDSSTWYDSTGDLEYLGVQYTYRTDRSFIDTFVDNDTFPDSSYEFKLRDSSYMLFTRLDSDNGGDMLFFNSQYGNWYKASIANTNLSSLTDLSTLGTSTNNIYRAIEDKYIKPFLHYRESDNAPLQYLHDSDLGFTLGTSKIFQKNDNIVAIEIADVEIDSYHNFGPDSGYLVTLVRYEPVTFGDDSSFYRHSFKFDMFLPTSRIPSDMKDSSLGVRDYVNGVITNYVMDSYAVDMSNFDVRDPTQRVAGSSLVRYLDEKIPLKHMRLSDIKYIQPFTEYGDSGLHIDSNDQSRLDSVYASAFGNVFGEDRLIPLNAFDSYNQPDDGFFTLVDSTEYSRLYKFLDS